MTIAGQVTWTPTLPTLGRSSRPAGDVVRVGSPHGHDDHHDTAHASADEFRRAHVRDTATHVMEGGHFLLDGLEMGGALASWASVVATGNAALAVGLAVAGVGHLKHGLKHRDAESVLEGTGSLFLSAKSGLETFASLAEGLAPAGGALASAGGAMENVIPVFGITHGLLDAGAGAAAVRDGLREKDRMRVLDGILGVGIGLSHTVASLGAGIPALVVAGGFLAAKMVVHGMHDHHHGAHYGHGFHGSEARPPDPTAQLAAHSLQSTAHSPQ